MTIPPIAFPSISGVDARSGVGVTGASVVPGADLAGTSAVTGADLTGVSGAAGVGGVAGVNGADPSGFADVLAQSVDALQAQHTQVDNLATQAATGDLRDVHDYMIAANEAQLGTEMLVSVRNKAVDAFNEILRMQV